MEKKQSTRVGRPKIISSKAVNTLKEKLTRWSLDPESRQIKQFYLKHNITRNEFVDACNQDPELERARVMAMYRLADRLQETVWEGSAPQSRLHYVDKFVHMVDEEYHAVQMQMKNISPEVKDAAAQIIGSLLMDQLTGRYVSNNPE